MIRFSAFLVAVAVGLLVAGVVTSKLLLVYIAIGVSGVALLALGIGAAVNWRKLAGQPTTARPGTVEPGTVEPGTVETSAQGPAPQTAVPERVTAPAAAGAGHVGVTPAGVAPAGSGWPVTTAPAPPRSARPAVGRRPAAGFAPARHPGRVHPAPRAPGARYLGVARRCDPGPTCPGPALCSVPDLRFRF